MKSSVFLYGNISTKRICRGLENEWWGLDNVDVANNLLQAFDLIKKCIQQGDAGLVRISSAKPISMAVCASIQVSASIRWESLARLLPVLIS